MRLALTRSNNESSSFSPHDRRSADEFLRDTPPIPAAASPPIDETKELLERAQQGDQSVLPELRKYLDTNPTLWKQYGDLDAQVERALIELIAGDDLILRESLHRQLTAMKTELSRPDQLPMERLLIERITTCWLQVQHADLTYAKAKGIDLDQATFMQKRLDQTNRRYLFSIKQLATVRRLIPKPAETQAASEAARKKATKKNQVQQNHATSANKTKGRKERKSSRRLPATKTRLGLRGGKTDAA